MTLENAAPVSPAWPRSSSSSPRRHSPSRLPTTPTTPPCPPAGAASASGRCSTPSTPASRARIEALVKDAFGGLFREMPLERAPGRARGPPRQQPRPRLLRRAPLRGRRPPGPGGGDREEPAHRRAGRASRSRSTARPEERITGLQIQPARPPKGTPAAAAAHGRAGEGRARRLPRPAGRGRGVLGHGAPGPQTARSSSRPRAAIADRNHGVPMRLDTKLNLGSMDKMFTAVVIGQLVDEGKLSFQDPVVEVPRAGRAGRRPTSRRCASSTC